MDNDNRKELRKLVETQIENILVAQAMMKDIPDRAIAPGLGSWMTYRDDAWAYRENPKVVTKALKELHCGAAACFGGWCSLHPHFQKQGLRRNEDGEPYLTAGVSRRMGSDVANVLFGERDAFFPKDTFGSDRRCIEDRLDRALKNRLDELAAYSDE